MADYLTVTALTKYLKRKFTADPHLQKVYLTGEVSNFRRRPKHQYFSLKDDGAVIGATMWQGAYAKLPFTLEEGLKVNAVGHLDLYEPSGTYSIIIDHMEPDGIGALALQYEQLKKKLQAQGLFDKVKRDIPRFPKKIAVITSPSGAVIQDIMTTVQRRYPIAQIYLYPAVVQGANAVPSILKQLTAVAQVDYDVLIIGRGGGSIEDLWAFNDEQLAKQLADMPMPVISSVGHETDVTIADFVADQRAATPTAAAEMATPIKLADLWLGIENWQSRMVGAMQRRVQTLGERLHRVQQSYVLTDSARLYEGVMQRLDIAQQQLVNAISSYTNNAKHNYQIVSQQMQPVMTRILEQQQQRFGRAVNGLHLVSPLAVLARGYSVVSNEQGVVITTEAINVDDTLHIRLADNGVITATVQDIQKGS
ncbi:MAG: exodeoxyribonuclease VII large subunit [Lactobacillaceae bacterium]|jgi:exodeoxyribonuclease VII large subunit|nr:exodeoxyribonuclease VII large subunit [Lactobacillaceae bacterium]